MTVYHPESNVISDGFYLPKSAGISLPLTTEFDEEKYEAMIREEGREEGLIKTLYTLVSKKIITMQQALEECGLAEEEFLEKMKE